ncbi:MAG TPA: M23 family metallopeptidase, partial [Chryseolinea sp.]|nr:M23 family metallopeptidase [Chryseolinea sp.]
NERALVIENNLLKKHKPILEEDLTKVEATLVNLKEVDEELYLRIFNSEAPGYAPLATSISREQALLADASGFRDLLTILKTKSEQLTSRSTQSNKTFANTIHISKEQLEILQSIPSIQPVDNPQLDLLVSGFGERINPFHKGNYQHPGADFAVARGTEVFSAASGRVINVNRTSLQAGYGNYIDIDHGHGFVTRYAHLEDIKVHRGQKVAKGITIGTIGNSGGSIMPHLHYEIIRDGEQVDPTPYMIEGLTSEQHHALLKLSVKQNQSLD